MAWRKVSLVAAIAGALLVATPSIALAATDEIDLLQENVTADDPDFDETDGDCVEDTGQGGALEGLEDDQDGWHFVLPEASGDSFVSLTLNFTDTNDDPVVVQINITAPNPDTGPGWEGFIGDPSDSHAWLITDAGWTLVSGTATIEEDGKEPQEIFVLSHTCPGTPDTPEESPTPSRSPSTSSTPPGGNGLPKTGAGLGGLIGAGIALVAGGAALLVWRRRRDATDAGADAGAAS